jgi:vacuolar protein sorting-associated protein 13A/C
VRNLLFFLKTQGLIRGTLGLDLFGNPMALISNVTGGFESLFVNPAKSFGKGPEEFSKALGEGTKGFVGKLVGGAVFGTASTLTGAIGGLTSTLAMDDEYAADRAQNLAGTTGVLSGVGKGAKQFGKGLFDGVTGVFMQPIKGAKKGGFIGGMKGFGKGMAGLVMKPVSGTVDLVSSSLAGVEAQLGANKTCVAL